MITYDYPVIEEAIGMMTKKAEEIRRLTDEQQQSVMKIMQDWQGSTADAYNKLCDDLEADLQANVNILNDLKVKMQTGAEEMKLTDSKGGTHVYG